MATGADVCKRMTELKGQRQPHENVWRDCYDYTFPLRSDGFDGNTVDAQQAQARKARIFDGTGTDGSRTLASAIMSGLTPANSRWFELDIEDETPEEKRFFDEAAETLWMNIHQSNFDAEAYEGCIDAVAAGWFVLYIDEDRERGGFTFEQWAISGCYLTSTRRDGLIDTCYREHTMSASAAVATFGQDKLSEQTRKLAKDKPDERVAFIHAIEPRQTYAVGARMAKNLPFASVVVEAKTKHLVRESGYHEFPVVAPRWMRIQNSCYGVGPVFDALPDIRTLNELKGMQLAAADLAVAGMWIAEDDGVLNPRTVKIGPRKIIVANSVESMKPLSTGSDFNMAEYLVSNLQSAIRKILMADQLQPQDGPAMTATEVHVRVELIRQLLGPIYGRLQAEYLRPLVERCFGIAYRAGVLGPAPDSLAGRDYSVKYVSPMARSQRLADVTAIERLYASAAGIAKARGDNTPLDRLNDAVAMEITAEGLGVPSRVLLTPEEFEAKQQAQAQAAQAAKEQQMSEQVMSTAADAQIQRATAA